MAPDLPRALLAGFLCLLPAAAAATEPAAVGVVSTLRGDATVARAALAAPLPLRFKDDVFGRDRISTGERSLVRVLLGGRALVTVRELSVLTIAEAADRAGLILGSGGLTMAVARARMRPGEAIEIHTPNAVVAIRGTVLAVHVEPAGPGAPARSRVEVFQGRVEVWAPGDPTGARALVGAAEQVTVTGRAVGSVEPAPSRPAADLDAPAPDRLPQHSVPPGRFLRWLNGREHGRALALAHGLMRGETSPGPARGDEAGPAGPLRLEGSGLGTDRVGPLAQREERGPGPGRLGALGAARATALAAAARAAAGGGPGLGAGQGAAQGQGSAPAHGPGGAGEKEPGAGRGRGR